MATLYEESDLMNHYVECYHFDSKNNAFPVRPHWHYFMELVLMKEGCAQFRIGDQFFEAKPGDMILIHPKALHSIYSADGNFVAFQALKLDINRIHLSSANNYTPKMRSIFRCGERKNMPLFFERSVVAKYSDASRIFARCIDEISTQNFGYDMLIHSEITELLVSILRIWQKKGFLLDSETYAEDSRYDIYSITEYIDDHLSDNIRVSDIAQTCGMSYSSFAKNFLSIYGKTCKEYIDDIRIHKVEDMLIFTDFDLNYIAQENGFSDCSHMIKSFRNFYGITPKQFRSNRKKNATKTNG